MFKKKVKDNKNLIYFIGFICALLLVVVGCIVVNINKKEKPSKGNQGVETKEPSNWLEYLLVQDISNIELSKNENGIEKKCTISKDDFKKLFLEDAKTPVKRSYACFLGSVKEEVPYVTVTYKNQDGKEYKFNNQDWISTVEAESRNQNKTHYMQDRYFLEAIDRNADNELGENTCETSELIYYASQDFAKSSLYSKLCK